MIFAPLKSGKSGWKYVVRYSGNIFYIYNIILIISLLPIRYQRLPILPDLDHRRLRKLYSSVLNNTITQIMIFAPWSSVSEYDTPVMQSGNIIRPIVAEGYIFYSEEHLKFACNGGHKRTFDKATFFCLKQIKRKL